MTDHISDTHIDRLVKARWLAMGLSQSDLAEVLNAAITPGGEGGARDAVDSSRLAKIAGALDLPVELMHHDGGGKQRASADDLEAMQEQLLDLRLLRAFRKLRDFRTKRLLVQLAEHMVKRQNSRADGVS